MADAMSDTGNAEQMRLQDWKALLSGILESTPDLIAMVDTNLRYTAFNKAYSDECRSIFGVEIKAGSLLEDVFAAPPEGRPMATLFRRALGGEVVFATESFGNPARSRKIYELRVGPLRDAGGRVIGAAQIGREVTTEHVRIREALAVQRRVLDVIIQTVPDAINLMRGSDLRIELVNPAYRSLSPWREFVGKTMDEAWPELGREFTRLCRQVLETGEPYLARDDQFMLRRSPDGPLESRYFNWGLYPVELPGAETRGVLNVAWETTERVVAEKGLRQALANAEEGDRMLSALMEYVPVGIAIADAPDVNVRLVSKAGEPPKPRDVAEIPEGIVEQWGVYRADGVTRPRLDEIPLWRATRKGENVKNEVWVLGGPDGRRTPRLCTAGPIRDAGGNITGGVVAWQDIADRQKAEDALRESNRRKDEFLAMLGHELRNPLAVIADAIKVIGARTLEDPVLVKARKTAERQAAHMARLVDDLLDVSRITEGKVRLKQEGLALADVIGTAVEAARPLIEAAGHRLHVSVPEEALRVEGDQVRLAQVVGNLLNNAAKYTPNGGEIRLTLEHRNGDAVITVRDNGVGIAPELLPRVFDLFVQGERGPDRAQGGLGIGLTMAKQLVDMHGGKIEAASEGPGRGSEFIITLPLTNELNAQRDGSGRNPAGSSPQRRIMVVDDNVDALEMLAMLVEGDGHAVVTAHNGAEALELAASWKPDVVLLDIGMPDMDGYEIARQMKQEPRLSRTRLIALTGYGGEEDIRKSRAAGFDHHLVKPVDHALLRQLLARTG
jgi:signal transduction histidine kinase/CheY-like chemotaxis protein